MLDQIFAQQFTTAIDITAVIISLLSALAMGALIALAYHITHRNIFTKNGFAVTLIIFPAVVTLIIMLIGDNVARAFTLAGAFSIIRFRSVAGEPLDMAYTFSALGIGMASVRSDRNSDSDSFGLIALCSIGPILSVLVLSLVYQPEQQTQALGQIPLVETTREAAVQFATAIPHYAEGVLTALLPIVAMFLIFQLVSRKFSMHQILRISLGLVYAYMGLVLFLTGVNVGFMPAGQLIGSAMAQGSQPWLLIPIGMLIGYFIVKAEPAVQVLTHQVEEISNGSISQQSIRTSLSIGVALSVGLAILRILTGISILWFLVPGYAISLCMTFFVPEIFTGIAFDSGGVASGPMTATFLLPLAMGACEALGGNMMTDAFGMVAMVARTPLVTIQLLGLYGKLRQRQERRKLTVVTDTVAEGIVYFD